MTSDAHSNTSSAREIKQSMPITDLGQTDVAIIGGGPGGSTIATLLANKGHHVTVFEKGQHPRFHVGESLLPMNLPILERLGVLEHVNQIGVPKLGADFTFGDQPEDFRIYRFEQALGNSPTYAFEVKRDQFDQLLFENCRKAGAHIFENTKVTSVEIKQNTPIVYALTEAGEKLQLCSKLIIDASGRDAFMAAKNGWRKPNRNHASAAIFGHFKGVSRRQGRDQGNISIYYFDHGWIWMIPLHDDIVSVGATCWPEYLKTRRGDTDQFLWETLALSPPAAARMRNAQSISPVRVAANYSYSSTKLWNDHYLAIGDACAFVDPVFSSGVYLAMLNAEQALPAVEHKLRNEQRLYRQACRQYQKSNRQGLNVFSWFIYRFTTPAMRNLFANPRNIWQIEDAVVSVLAGDIFNNKKVSKRLWLFKAFYAVSWLLTIKQSFQHMQKRRLSLQNKNRGLTEELAEE